MAAGMCDRHHYDSVRLLDVIESVREPFDRAAADWFNPKSPKSRIALETRFRCANSLEE
jgi:hypothetical protein